EPIDPEVTFEPGEDQVEVPLIPIDDGSADPGEEVTLTIDDSTDYVIGDEDSASMPIVDDQTPVVTVTKIADGAEGLADGMFRFSRTGDTSGSLTISYVVGGTAVPGTNYTALGGSLTFPAGVDSVDVPVHVLEDNVTEGTTTVVASVVSGSTYGADPTATA